MYKIGQYTHISPKAKIIGMKGNMPNSFIVGDNVFIGDDVQIICDDVYIGDYSKIHHHTNIHGQQVHVGHNAWIGQYTIIDGLGTTNIGHNFCAGAASALWSHMKYGDTLEGCNFNHLTPLVIGQDVWIGGNVTVTPVIAHDKSMALANSVITHTMETNRIYAGVPAIDITNKIGPPFTVVATSQKIDRMRELLEQFGNHDNQIVIVASTDQIMDDGRTYFAVETRQYTKKLSAVEIAFMRFLLPEKGKFLPIAIYPESQS